MGNDKYSNLTTKQLQNRKKYASILLVVLTFAVVLAGSVQVYNLVNGKGFINTLFVSAAACFVIFIPIYMGKKKIEEELKNRADSK
ncbi:MAG: hypothetical protein EP344_16625 [Bacteroidetes bacterium]|nr:MAG: hypothetical protein EP344_16625 [Bacteroidota bacterium]